MKKIINKRNQSLNERLMSKWGFKPKTTLQENTAGAADFEELENSLYVDEINESSKKIRQIINEVSQEHNFTLTEEQIKAIEEGLWDRIKAKTASATSAVTDPLKRGWKALRGGEVGKAETPKQRKARARTQSIMKSKLAKFQKIVDDTLGDLKSLGLTGSSPAVKQTKEAMKSLMGSLKDVAKEVGEPAPKKKRKPRKKKDPEAPGTSPTREIDKTLEKYSDENPPGGQGAKEKSGEEEGDEKKKSAPRRKPAAGGGDAAQLQEMIREMLLKGFKESKSKQEKK